MPTELNSTGLATRQALATDELLAIGEGTGPAGADEIRRLFGGPGLFENLQTGAAYTAALSDAGECITMNSASAKTLTIPLNATVAFAVGTVLFPFNAGNGVMTVQFTGAATVNGAAAGRFVLLPLDGAMIWQTAANVWRAQLYPSPKIGLSLALSNGIYTL